MAPLATLSPSDSDAPNPAVRRGSWGKPAWSSVHPKSNDRDRALKRFIGRGRGRLDCGASEPHPGPFMLTINSTGASGVMPATPLKDACRSRQRTGPFTPCSANTTRLLRALDADLHEALVERGVVEVEHSRQGLGRDRPAPNRLVHAQIGRFQSGVSASSLARMASGPG